MVFIINTSDKYLEFLNYWFDYIIVHKTFQGNK